MNAADAELAVLERNLANILAKRERAHTGWNRQDSCAEQFADVAVMAHVLGIAHGRTLPFEPVSDADAPEELLKARAELREACKRVTRLTVLANLAGCYDAADHLARW